VDDWFRGGFRPGRFGKRFRLSTTPNLARPGVTEFTLAPGEDAGEILITVTDLPDTWGDLTVAGDGLGALGILEWGNDVDGWQTLVDPAALGPVLVTASPALWGSISTIRVRGVSSAGRTGTSDEKSVFVPVQGEEPIPEGSFFVSPAGNDSTGDGSVGNPWRTLTYAATQITASDTITLEDGVYTDTNGVTLPSGADGAHTTVRARNRWGAIFQHGNYATLRTYDNHHITIDGLYFLLSTGGGGVNSEGGHHVTVKNCKQRGGSYHFFAGHNGDFFTVTDNDISGIRFSGFWSAISFYQLENVTGVTTTGFRNTIARNTIFDCYTISGSLTDGNGIIVDDSHNLQAGGNDIPYAYETLVDGNLVVSCGGKGIQVVFSDLVTVRGNTCALNGNPGQTHDDTDWWAEISISISNNCTVVNNVAITDSTLHDGKQREFADTGLNGYGTGHVWKNNCGWDGTGFSVWLNEDGVGPTIGDNPLRGTDPEVVSATASALTANYQLRAGSPCLDAGTAAYGLPSIDITGAPRVADSAVDIGAYEGVAAYAMVANWITTAGLAAGQATWTDTVGGLVLTEGGTVTTEASDGTGDLLVFDGSTDYMEKTDGVGDLPVGNAARTIVFCGNFTTASRWGGFAYGENADWKSSAIVPQGGGSNEISGDFRNGQLIAEDDVVLDKGMGIYFLTISSLGLARLYHGIHLVAEATILTINTGTTAIKLMRSWSGNAQAGRVGCVRVYDGVLPEAARDAVIAELNPLFLGLTDAPVATDVVFTASTPTTGVLTATLPDWRSEMTGVMTSSATKPSIDQINLGQDHLSAPASPFSIIAPAASSAIEIGPIGLTAGVTNYPHYYMRSAYGQVGTVQTGTEDATPSVAAPTAIIPAAFSFNEVTIAPAVVATLVADVAPVTFAKTGGNAAFTVSSAGVVTLVSDLADGSYSFDVRATSDGGTFDDTIDVTVTAAAAAADLEIRFGALTPTGEGGAQARDAAGYAFNFTSITAQPSTRWSISSGRLVATGTPAMASEQITAVVDGATVTVNITIVPNMVSVKDGTEFAAISMTPAGTGDFAIELRAGANIAAATATSKIAGTNAGSRRTLGGTLTLQGERVRGAPAANIDGKFKPRFFAGGLFKMTSITVSPTDPSDRAYTTSTTGALLQIDQSPTTDIVLDGVVSVCNPDAATGWPGRTSATTGNDRGHDPWGALVRVNTVTGTFRAYVDGQVGNPDIITCGTSGVKRVLLGMHSLGGGVFEMQFGDRNGTAHSISNSLVSGEGASRSMIEGETITGRDGATAVIMAAPSGVDTAGGRYATTGPCYTYQIRGVPWMNSPSAGSVGNGTASSVKSLTIRNCTVTGGQGMVHPLAIEHVTIEQNNFGLFTGDCIKIGNPNASPNPKLIFRRNLFYGSLSGATDLGAEHCDYIQVFGGTSVWPDARVHHNIILCNKRGNGQGWWCGDVTKWTGTQVFGNISLTEGGGHSSYWGFVSDCDAFYNTDLVNRKETGLPTNWAPVSGAGQDVTFAAIAPATDLYAGWNAARRFQFGSTNSEKNYGANGNTTSTQDALFAGIGGSRPFYITTLAELMTGAATLLAAPNLDVGALGPHTNWAGFPSYVTTTPPAGVTLAADIDFGVPSTLALGAVTGTGGTESVTGTATVVTPGGAVYYVAYPSTATVPNAAQVQAGLDGDGAAATVDGSLGASTAGVKTIPSTAIAAGTYKISYVQVSGALVSPVATITGTLTATPSTFGNLLGTLTGNIADIVNPAVATGSVAVAVGDLVLAVLVEQTAQTATACADNLGNTYTAVSAGVDGGTVAHRGYYSRVTVAGTLTSVSFTVTGGTHNACMIAAAFQGPFAVSPVDAIPTATTNVLATSIPCPATGTLAQADELVACYLSINGNQTITADSPNLLALRANSTTVQSGAIGYQKVSATTTVTPAFTVGVTPTVSNMSTVTFKKA
jgi:hypothetical protein